MYLLSVYLTYNKRIYLAIAKNNDGLTESFKNLIENLWPSYNSDYKQEKYIGNNSTNKYFKPKKWQRMREKKKTHTYLCVNHKEIYYSEICT